MPVPSMDRVIEFRSTIPGIAWPLLSADRHAAVVALQHQFEQIEFFDRSIQVKHQLHQMARVVNHAAQWVPFYVDRLKPYPGVSPHSFGLEQLEKLPIMQAGDIRTSFAQMVSRKPPRDHGSVEKVYTRSLPGGPSYLVRPGVNSLLENAIKLRDNLWQCRDLSARHLSIRHLPKSVSEKFDDDGWLPGCETGPALVLNTALSVDRLYSRLIEFDPVYLEAPLATIEELLAFCRTARHKPRALKEVRSLSSISNIEELSGGAHSYLRNLNIEHSVSYSLHGLVTLTLPCPEGYGHHLQVETAYCELLDDEDAPCGEHISGRLVVTTLQNFLMPLIRLDLGTRATPMGACRCGRTLPLIRVEHNKAVCQ